MKIIGAGLAGLIAGNLFPMAELIEAGSQEQIKHKALLRFRSKSVGDAVGIEFRKVQVNKGLFSNGRHAEPSIRLANQYSMKVVGKLADRSIWNLAPAERYIAPEDLIEQLVQRCGNRITWGKSVVSFSSLMDRGGEAIISTMPIGVAAKIVNEPVPESVNFKSAPIVVRRWRVPNADVFQTIYFPDPETTLYRASITKDLLIAEFIEREDERAEQLIVEAFGLEKQELIAHDVVKQKFGKISPIDNAWRRKFIFELTQNYGVYSLGRFATWRNILLDDVLEDIYVIKKLMAGDSYTAKLNA